MLDLASGMIFAQKARNATLEKKNLLELPIEAFIRINGIPCSPLQYEVIISENKIAMMVSSVNSKKTYFEHWILLGSFPLWKSHRVMFSFATQVSLFGLFLFLLLVIMMILASVINLMVMV